MFGAGKGAGSAGMHTVQDGETLWSISRRYRIVMQDIAIENKLSAPFKLSTGTRLKLPPPQEYKVRSGDTLYEVSRLYDADMSEIARLNHLSEPYVLRDGQVLRLPSKSNKIKEVELPVYNEVAVAAAPVQSVSKEPLPVQKARITAQPPRRSGGKLLQPVDGKIISGFGPKKSGLHNDGINIEAPKGTPVKAAENGVVVYAGNELRGSGNLVLIRHEGGIMSAYAHMDKIVIQRGATVQRGQTIGTVGATGSVSTPQLHFEVRKGTRAQDPKGFI